MSKPKPKPPAVPPEPNASDEPHDVLAAEEFAMPAPDEALHGEPVKLPPDPSGDEEPHDILAAEQFAMPAPRPAAHAPTPQPAAPARGWGSGQIAGALGGLLLALLIRRIATKRG